MDARHVSFWVDVAGKLGPPVFAATLVGCLLQGEVGWTHALLLALGFGLIVFQHWHAHHRGAGHPGQSA